MKQLFTLKHSPVHMLAVKTILAGFAMLAPFATRAASVTLEPSNQSVPLGSFFYLKLGVQGLGNHTAPLLGGFDLDIVFDPSLLHFESISFGDPTLGNLLEPATPSISGYNLIGTGDSVNLYSVSLDTPTELAAVQPNHFTIATLRFSALAIGSGGLNLSSVVLSDADGNRLDSTDMHGATISVTPTFVPDLGPGLGSVTMALSLLALVRYRVNSRESDHRHIAGT